MDRNNFEALYIYRHLKNLPYREALIHVQSARNVSDYNRSFDDGHLDDCWFYFKHGMKNV